MFFAVVFVLPASVFVFLQSNIVQTYIARKLSAYLSEKLQTEVSIGRVDVRFFLNLTLKDVYIADKHHNPLLRSEKMVVDLEHIDIGNTFFVFDKVLFTNTDVALRKYKGEEKLNLQFIIDFFSPAEKDTTKPTALVKVKVNKLQFSGSRFIYCDEEKMRDEDYGVDYADLDIRKLNIDMRDVAVVNDSVAADIRSISFEEKSGFVLNKLTAQTIVSSKHILLRNLNISTPVSSLALDLGFVYDNYRGFNDFINQVTIVSELKKSSFQLNDLTYFVPAIKGMNSRLMISALVYGKVKNLKIKDLNLATGQSTVFSGDVSMNGLPDFDETFIRLKIKNLSTTTEDIAAFRLPSSASSPNTIVLPDIVKRLGHVTIKGNFTGFYSSFVANATFNTAIGSLYTDVILKDTYDTIRYQGLIKSDGINLDAIARTSGLLGRASFNLNVAGSGLSAATAAFQLKGMINSIQFKGYEYHNLEVDGGLAAKIFNGSLSVNDPNLEMSFKGTVDINDSLPDFDLNANIRYANLKNINVLKDDSISEVEGIVGLNFKGNSIDNLQGEIKISSASFRENKKIYNLDSLHLVTTIDAGGYRTFNLRSDYADAEFNGYFVFEELGNSFKRFLLYFMPNIDIAADMSVKDSVRQQFDFKIRLYNATPFLKYFVQGIKVAPNTMFTGNFSTLNKTVLIHAVSSELDISGKKFINWNLQTHSSGDSLLLSMESDTLKLADSIWVNNFVTYASAIKDSIHYNILWDNNKTVRQNRADIKLYSYFKENDETIFGFKPSELVINDSLWYFNDQGYVVFDTSRIEFNNVRMFRRNQSMEVNGAISENPFDALSVKFLNYNISNIDYVTNMKGFDLDGIISGNIVLSDIYLVPTFYADVSINDFGFNGDRLGNAIIRSKWDNKKKGISIDARVIYTGNSGTGMPLVVNGYYYPSSETQNFDLSINVDNFRLRTIAPYLSSFATLVNGTASGSVMLEGTNKMPLISGYVKLMRTVLKINFLNTTYAFAYDSIKISNSEFVIRDLMLFDQPNNDTAIMNARIYHNNFQNLSFDITIEPRKLMCLNTGPAQNESFYGKAYASGIAHIYGSADNIKMDITASSEKGTEIYIPIGGPSSAGPSDYITFVNKEVPADETDEDKGKKVSGVSLDMSLDVTPDAEIQLMLDPRTADRLKCKGNGDIRITISAGGVMKIYGDYNITTGDYLFTFQNIINKHFNIQEGSSVKWNGDPYNGELDISAVYKLKANLAGLGVDTVRRLVPVECIINISEKLSNPEFSFDVRLPSLNDFEKAPYLTAINQDLNNNFISLLIINSFVRSSVATGSNYSAANASLLGRSASEVLSNQLSNWLSQISQDVDIGINYRPGDNITQEEVEVALSTQLFNDRVTIESNLGVSTGQGGTANKNANQIVGDVNVEVKLTKSLKLNVFNRSNQYDVLQNIAPYTQGIGISYRKEFNTLKDLFKKRERKAGRLNKAKSKE